MIRHTLNRFRFAWLLLPALLVAGCASKYDIVLTSNLRLQSVGKPRLDGDGFYVFKDTDGRLQRVNSMRVREVAPTSMRSTKGYNSR